MTPDAARTYADYLGRRFGRFMNILWIQGGDHDPHDRTDAVRALAEGLRRAAPHQLQTFHAHHEPSTRWFGDDAWLDVTMAYSWGEAHAQVLDEYRRSPRRPIVLGETIYEDDAPDKDARRARRQAWGAMLSGAAGHAFGAWPVWIFEEGWEAALGTPGAVQMGHLRSLLADRPWRRLVPDDEHRALTVGRGERGSAEYVPAARTPDGALLLAYLPSPRAVAVAADAYAEDTTARWYDPTSGEFLAAMGRATGTGERVVPPPGPNAAGDGDWVLVLERA